MCRLRLRRSLLALPTAFLLSCISTSPAGSYLSRRLGRGPVLQGELMTAADGDGEGGNGRLALGQSFGRVALEGSLSRFGLATDQATAAGVHARLSLPIEGSF